MGASEPLSGSSFTDQYYAEGSETKPLSGSVEASPLTAGDVPDTWSMIAERTHRGALQTQEYYHNAFIMADQSLSDEDRKQRITDGPLSQYMESNGTLNDQAYQSAPWYAQGTADVGQMLPGMGAAIGTGVATGTVTSAAPFSIAAALSRIPVAGPFLAGSTGIAGVTNFGAGMIIGQYQSMQTQAAGEIYGDLIKSGISHKAALPLALAYGSTSGALESLSLTKLGKFAGKALGQGTKQAMSRTLTSPLVKRLQKNAFARLGADYLENVATEGGTEYAQEFLKGVAEYHAAVLERSDPGDFDLAKVHENSKQAFMSAVRASALLGLGTGVGGYTLGKGKATVESVLSDQRVREVIEQLKNTDPNTVIRNLRNAVEELPFHWETEEDGKSEVQYTQDGKLFKVGIKETVLDAEASTPADQGVLTPEEVLGQTPQEPNASAAQPVLEIKDGQIQIAQGAADAIGQAAQTLQETGDTQAALDTLFGSQTQTDFVSPDQMDANAREIGPAMDSTPMTPIEVQARKNQIASDLRTLRREELNLDAKFKQAEKTGRATDATLQKMETVLIAQEKLKFERELLESGLLDQESVAQESGKLRMSQISRLVSNVRKSAAKLSRQKEKLAGKIADLKQNAATAKQTAADKANQKADKAKAAGERTGRFQENKGIRAMQDMLIQVINAATVDKNQRNELKATVNKVTNQQQFNKASQTIQGKIAKMDAANSKKRSDAIKNKIIGQIDKLLAVGDTKMSGGRLVNAKLDADTTAKLNLFKGYVKNNVQAALHVVDFMNRTVDVNGVQTPYSTLFATGQAHLIDPKDLSDYQIAAMALNLNNKSEIELNIIKANIAQWVMDGRDTVAQKQDALRQQRLDEATIAEESTGADSYTPYEGKPSTFKAAQENAEATAANWLNFDDLMKFISPQDPNHAIAQLLDPTEARRNYYTAQETVKLGAMQTLQNALIAAGSNQSIWDKMNEDTETEFQLDYEKKNGDRPKPKYTKAEIIDIWLKMQDEDLHDTMRDTDKGNGWTLTGDVAKGKSFEELIEASMTPEDFAVGNALLEFYDTYHARVNAFFREKYGVDLPKKDNYSPVARESYEVVPGSKQAHDLMFTSIVPGSAKSRVNSLKALVPRNSFNLMNEHINAWEHFMAFDATLGTMKGVFSNSKINKTITQRHGYGTKAVIDGFIERFIQDTPMLDSQDGAGWLYRAMRADISKAALGLKQGYQMATQLSSGVALWADMDMADIGKGMIAYLKNAKETERVLRSSPILARRFREGNSVDIEGALRKNGIGAEVFSRLFGVEQLQLTPAKYDALTRLMFDGIRYGDAGVARMFGGPLYWAERAKGKSEQEALMAVERGMERTQQGDTVEQLPNFWANNPALYTLFGMFSLQPGQMMSHSMIAQRDLGNELAAAKFDARKTSDAIDKFGKRALAYWLLPGLFFGVAKTLPALLMPPGGDDEERNREALYELASSSILGPISGAGLVGAMIEGVWFANAKPLFGLDKGHFTEHMGRNNLTKTYFDNPYAVYKAWEKLMSADDETEAPSGGDELEEGTAVEDFLVKAGAGLAPAGGYPAAAFNTPANLGTTLSAGDFIGAMFALQGWPKSALKTRLGSAQDENEAPGGEDEEGPSSVYDQFMEGYLRDQKTAGGEPVDDDTERPDYEALFLQGALSGTMDENSGE